MRTGFIILFFALSLCLKAQYPHADTCYFTLYGGEQAEEFRDIVNVKSDSGYAALGTTSSFTNGSGDFYLVRTDWKGNTLWSRNIGTPGIDKGYAIKSTYDGGYIIGGYTNYTFGNDYDMYVVKTDSDGFVQWTKNYGGSDWDFLYSIAVMPDSGYVLCGESYSFGNSSEVFVIRTDKNGNIVWQRNYGGVNRDGGHEIIVTSDTLLAIAGYTESYGAGMKDAYFMKCKATNGDTIFTRTFGGALDDEFYSLVETTWPTLEGYVLVGYDRSFGAGAEADMEGWVMKIDTGGTFKWSDSHGDNVEDDVLTCVSHLGLLDFFVSGYTGFGGVSPDLQAGVVNFGGFWLYIYSNNYGGSLTDYAWANTMSLRNDFIMAGSSESFNAQNGDALITINDSIRSSQIIHPSVSSDTLVGVDQNELESIGIYPNPSTGVFYFQTNTNIQSLSLYDVQGCLLNIQLPANFDAGIHKLDLSALKQGIYFLRGEMKNGRPFVIKIVLTGR